MKPEITEFMPTARGGGRNRRFVIDGIGVMVEAHEDDHAARDLAEVLSAAMPRLRALGDEVQRLKAQVPPREPARLLGPGYVRFRDRELWLLNKRENGWSSFGVRLDDWHDLFRRLNVAVTAHGTDEHGMWWRVEPIGCAS